MGAFLIGILALPILGTPQSAATADASRSPLRGLKKTTFALLNQVLPYTRAPEFTQVFNDGLKQTDLAFEDLRTVYFMKKEDPGR